MYFLMFCVSRGEWALYICPKIIKLSIFHSKKETIDSLCYCSTACIDCHLTEVMHLEDSDQTFTVSMLENFSQNNTIILLQQSNG